MSIAPLNSSDTDSQHPTDVESGDIERPVKRKKKRRSTSHLKAVPETLAQREQIRDAAEKYAEPLDKTRPFNKGELEQHGPNSFTADGIARKVSRLCDGVDRQLFLETAVSGDPI